MHWAAHGIDRHHGSVPGDEVEEVEGVRGDAQHRQFVHLACTCLDCQPTPPAAQRYSALPYFSCQSLRPARIKARFRAFTMPTKSRLLSVARSLCMQAHTKAAGHGWRQSQCRHYTCHVPLQLLVWRQVRRRAEAHKSVSCTCIRRATSASASTGTSTGIGVSTSTSTAHTTTGICTSTSTSRGRGRCRCGCGCGCGDRCARGTTHSCRRRSRSRSRSRSRCGGRCGRRSRRGCGRGHGAAHVCSGVVHGRKDATRQGTLDGQLHGARGTQITPHCVGGQMREHVQHLPRL